MNDETAFQSAMSARPDDNHLRLVYADWLDERGDPRGELLRLLHTLTQSIEVPDRDRLEDRLRALVAAGVPAVGPFFTNSIGMKFAWIPAGTFLMGSPPEEVGRSDDEIQYPVTLTRGFYLGTHPVTQSSWQAVMGNNPSQFRGDDLPVEQVAWEDSWEFLRKLSVREGHTYRLPTEEEWEFACRAGTTTPFHFGNECNGKQANCDGSEQPYGTDKKGPSLEMTSPVGSYTPNALGLFDMHGNVCECCIEHYDEDPDAATDLTGPERGGRVLRGGAWRLHPWDCRAASRDRVIQATLRSLLGFRVAARACRLDAFALS
jgi:uncharacterized protein (TIGR02996 family)